jgi:hypothetical protein
VRSGVGRQDQRPRYGFHAERAAISDVGGQLGRTSGNATRHGKPIELSPSNVAASRKNRLAETERIEPAASTRTRSG